MVGFSTGLMAQTATPPATGDGSSSNPYQIATLNNLYWITQNPTSWDKFFIQMADIDASGTSIWDSDGSGGYYGFSPIGNATTYFTGAYEGNGHIIDGLYINRPNTNYVGFFGYTEDASATLTTSIITNLGLTNVNITGKAYVGAIAGDNNLFIYYCFSTGSLLGVEKIGGFVGNNQESQINNCYSRCSVSGSSRTGGFVGSTLHQEDINNCYSTGGVDENWLDGGFVADQQYTNIGADCFWDMETSGQSTSDGGTGRRTDRMKNYYTYTNGEYAVWDFLGETANGTNDYWGINASFNDGYPFLAWQGYSNVVSTCQWPTETPTNITFGTVTSSSVVLAGYTAPTNGADGYVIYINNADDFTVPNDGASLTPNTTWSNSGQQCVYFGTSITPNVPVTNLSSTGTYYFKIYAYTNCTGTETYEENGAEATYSMVISATAPALGDGTSGNPYQIATLENLYWITQNSASWSKYFIQTADIDASETNQWDNGLGFSPVGVNTTYFTGSYDGQNHSIDGIYINRPEESRIAFFGSTSGATINNLNLSNVNISGNTYVGALVGYNWYDNISNCTVSGTISGSGNVGGISGYAYGNTGQTIQQCSSACTILATGSAVGGLIGYINSVNINNCNSSGTVSGVNYVGGLIGQCVSTAVTASYSTGTVNCDPNTSNYTGGLIGGITSTLSNINRCYATGDVTTYYSGGGLVGTVASNNNITDCYARGNVGVTSNYAGGLLGASSGTISNCYSTGSVSLVSSSGGLMGLNSGTVSNSFWDTETSGRSQVGAGTGLTTAQMQDYNTYTDVTTTTVGLTTAWDFINDQNDDAATNDYWDINQGGDGYPILTYQPETDGFLTGPKGAGTADNPFQISSLDDLQWIMDNPTSWSYVFIQTADIDASATSTWNNGAGFSPIGNSTTKFSGTYNGQMHVIDGLFINSPANNYVALFGYTSATGNIENLGLENIDFTGSAYVSGLVGVHTGIISNCYSSGQIVSVNNSGILVGYNIGGSVDNSYTEGTISGNLKIGGLVGNNSSNGSVTNCYSYADVSRNSGQTAVNFGSLIGYNSSASVQNCYATGSVYYTGTTSPTDKGFFGEYVSGTYTNNFFDSDISNQTSATGATAKTTADMQDISTFTSTAIAGLSTAWDFILNLNDDSADNNYWDMDQDGSGYPILSWQPEADNYLAVPAGSGTSVDPYQIAILKHLEWLMNNSSNWNKYYIQVADIDAAATSTWDSGTGFTPMGNTQTVFTGSYNGKGFSISNLFINRPGKDTIGMFGYVTGRLDSISLINVIITGRSSTGALAGSFNSYYTATQISNCSASGTVTGQDTVGGLMGYYYSNHGTYAAINKCSSSVSVTGVNTVGGLVGRNYYAYVYSSYASGNVTASGNTVGGLIGYNFSHSDVFDSYATGNVSGTSDVGGLVGVAALSDCKDSYSTGSVSGTDQVGGFVGYNSSSLMQHCYSTGNVTGSNLAAGGFVGYGINSSARFFGCYAKGNVDGYAQVGGFAGQITSASTLDSCYSVGAVTGTSSLGGLVGFKHPTGYVYNSFFDTETSGQPASTVGTGLTTTEMKELCNYIDGIYANWDFMDETANGTGDVWGMNASENDGYPYLAWQGFTNTATCCPRPSAAATSLTFGSVTSGSIVLAGYASPTGGADGYAIYVNSSNTWTVPSDGDEPVADLSWNDGGQQCIYFGTSVSPNINVTSLSPGVTYYFKVYAYNDCSGVEKYENSGLEGNQPTNKLNQTITFTTSSVTYGAADFSPASASSGLTVSYSSSDENVITIVSGKTHIVGAGTCTITANQSGDATYNAAPQVTNNITVAKKLLTLTADNKSKTYGDANPSLTISYSGFAGGEDASVLDTEPVASTSATSSSNIGTYNINITTVTDNNYTFSYVIGTLTVNAKAITVTADANQSKVYGEVDAEKTYTVSPALVNGDSFTGALSRVAGQSAGTYAILIGNLSAGSNYTITYAGTNFEITTKPITVTATAGQSKVYAESDPAFTYNVSPALISGDSFSGSLSRAAGENVGSYTLSQGSLSAGSNYTITYVSDNFAITVKAITVTANASQSKVYGASDPTFTYSVNPALKAGDSFTGALSRVAGENAGTYAISQGNLSAGSNYNISYVGNNFVITAKAITVTTNTGQSKVYGASDPGFTYSVNPALEIGDSFTGSLSRAIGENVGTYAIVKGSLSAGSNYTISYVSNNFEITKASLTATADNKTKIYGAANPALTITYSGFVNGESASVIDTKPSISTTADATSAVGTYTISLSGGSDNNYTFGTLTAGTLTVNKATLTVTADNKSKTYGAANPTLTVSYSGFVNGDDASDIITEPAAITSANASSDVGTYDITASGGIDDNYDFAYVTGILTITKADQTITITTVPQKDVATDALTFDITASTSSSLALSYAIQSGPATISGNTITLSGATGSVVVAVSQAGNNNYNATSASTSFNVIDNSKQNQTITFSTISDKFYGDVFTLGATASSNLGVSYTVKSGPASINGSTVTVTGIGTVTITANQSGDATYNPADPVDQSFNAQKANLTVTADDKSKTYSQANPALTISYTGFVNGEDESNLTTQPVAATTANVNSNAGQYAITLSGGSASNYNLSLNNGTLTVNKATLVVTADDKSKTYGEANPALSLSYSGFVNSEDESALTTQPTASTTATSASDAGQYAISLSGGTAVNYAFSMNNGTLTVGKAALTVTADDKSKVYGEANPDLTITYSGFVNSEDSSFLTTLPVASTTATADSDAGTYDITVSGSSSNNYSLSYVVGTLTVTKADQTITVTTIEDKVVSSGPFYVHASASSGLELSYSVISGPATISDSTVTLTGEAGSVSIEVSQAGNTNYNAAERQTVSFQVNAESKLDQTITFKPIADKTFGDPDFALMATASSGLDIVFTVISGNATLTGHVVSINGAGNVVIEASQAGNGEYNQAPAVQQSFMVNKANQTITFNAIADKVYGDVFNLEASSSEGLDVYFTVVSGYATLNGKALTLTGAGSVVVEANQAGNDTIASATAVQQTITVNKANLTISAVDTLKTEGEENPEFELAFDGFVLGDTQADLDELPAISCSTDKSSAPGSYDIILSGGIDADYEFTLVNGTLTVNKGNSVNMIELLKIKVYPNPAVNYLIIDPENNVTIKTLEIYNQVGERIYYNETGALKINVSTYNSGAYILLINKIQSVIFMKD